MVTIGEEEEEIELVEDGAIEMWCQWRTAVAVGEMVGLRACDGRWRRSIYQSKTKEQPFHLVAADYTYSYVRILYKGVKVKLTPVALEKGCAPTRR